MTEPPPLAPGVLAAPDYEVLEHLHRSRAFDVYDAWSLERSCRCVLKLLRPDRSGDATARRRLEQEGRLLRRLAHPHIVRGYELVEGERPVVVTETLRGETLAHLVESTGPLNGAEAAVLGMQLGSAVGYLHRRGYLHLDLKPSNIVVDVGRAIIVDLSIARKPGRARPGTGTWCYLAPEQATGAQLSEATDVWGVGAVLFEALTGDAPFDDEADDAESAPDENGVPPRYLQLEGRAPRLARRPGIPRAVGAVVDACLEPELGRRPTLDDLSGALGRVRGAGSPRARRR